MRAESVHGIVKAARRLRYNAASVDELLSGGAPEPGLVEEPDRGAPEPDRDEPVSHDVAAFADPDAQE
jgi:hypothetical protein